MGEVSKMPEASLDLSKHVLRPTAEEIRTTRVLFHTRYATDLTEERRQAVGQTVYYHWQVLRHLRGLGLNVTPGSDPAMLFSDLPFDYIYFTQVEGTFAGHELFVPCMAALRGIAYLGPSAPIRALSEDKVLGKVLASSIGVGVAKHHVIDPGASGIADLSLPGHWVLKPRTGVMSDGIAFIDGEAGWRKAIAMAADPRHGGREFVAEEFVPGLNLAVPVIEGLPPRSLSVFHERGEPRNNILTESGKEGKSADYASAPYFGPGAREALAAAERLAAAIAPFDYARFDFRFDPNQNRLVFLEVNMNCAIGPGSVVANAAQRCGIDYQMLIGHVFTHSLRRQSHLRATKSARGVTAKYQGSSA